LARPYSQPIEEEVEQGTAATAAAAGLGKRKRLYAQGGTRLGASHSGDEQCCVWGRAACCLAARERLYQPADLFL